MAKQNQLLDRETDITPTNNIPDFLKEEKLPEDVTIDRSEISISELSLAQRSSAVCDSGEAKPGDFVDSITHKNYGDEVEIIVLDKETEWIKFGDDRRLAGKSKDGEYWEDGTKLTEEESWGCKTHTFYVLVRSSLQPFPMFLSFRRMSEKNGLNFKKLINTLSLSANKPFFARTYKLYSELQQKNQDKFYVKRIASGDYVTEEEYYFAKETYKQMKQTVLNRAEKENRKEEMEKREIAAPEIQLD